MFALYYNRYVVKHTLGTTRHISIQRVLHTQSRLTLTAEGEPKRTKRPRLFEKTEEVYPCTFQPESTVKSTTSSHSGTVCVMNYGTAGRIPS